jgi:hypothetical protein
MDAIDAMFSPNIAGIEIGSNGPGGGYGAPPAAQFNRGSMKRLVAAGVATTVGAGLTADINAVTSQAFKMERFYVNAAAATALFVINNIRVSTFSLNVTNNALCVDMFLRDAVGSDLSGYTAQQGVGLTVNVTNPSGGGVLLNASFIGWALVEG